LSAAEPGEAEAHEVEATHAPLEGMPGEGQGSASAAVQTPLPVVELAPTEPPPAGPEATGEPEASQSSSLPDEMAQ